MSCLTAWSHNLFKNSSYYVSVFNATWLAHWRFWTTWADSAQELHFRLQQVRAGGVWCTWWAIVSDSDIGILLLTLQSLLLITLSAETGWITGPCSIGDGGSPGVLSWACSLPKYHVAEQSDSSSTALWPLPSSTLSCGWFCLVVLESGTRGWLLTRAYAAEQSVSQFVCYRERHYSKFYFPLKIQTLLHSWIFQFNQKKFNWGIPNGNEISIEIYEVILHFHSIHILLWPNFKNDYISVDFFSFNCNTVFHDADLSINHQAWRKWIEMCYLSQIYLRFFFVN